MSAAAQLVRSPFDRTLDVARTMAQSQAAPRIELEFVLLAILASSDVRWPDVVAERGGLSFEDAAKRYADLERETHTRAGDARPLRYVPSMIMRLRLWVRSLLNRVRRWLGRSTPPKAGWLPLSPAVVLTLEVATALNRRSVERRELAPDARAQGALLLALAVTPGRHLRLVDNAALLASAVRREIGLDRRYDRVLLRLDQPRVFLRRISAQLRNRRVAHGWLSRWGVAHAAFCFGAVLWAMLIIGISLVPTLTLYFMLAPAVALLAGVRAMFGLALGLEARACHWDEIPGGEAELRRTRGAVPGNRLAILLLAPRAIAFVCCVASVCVLTWRSSRLGVPMTPTLFARPDFATGTSHDPLILLPAAVVGDFVGQNGFVGGIGLLAGVGCGLISLPTFRELELVRLHRGDDVRRDLGQPPTAGGVATYPLVLLTRGLALIEAVLPFRGGPVFVTVYVVPLFVAFLLTIGITALLPY